MKFKKFDIITYLPTITYRKNLNNINFFHNSFKKAKKKIKCRSKFLSFQLKKLHIFI